MNLDELRTVQSKERRKDSLQNLRPSFYREVGEYIADLEDERDRIAEASDDPFSSPEVARLTDEIETAKDVVEAIYERRMGKLVKQASLAAAGMPADDDGLTAEEQDLFADLVERIQSNKGRVLDVLEGKTPERDVEHESDSSAPPTPPDADETAEASGSGRVEPDGPSADPPESPVSPDRPTDDRPAESHPGSEPNSDGGVSVADVMGGDAVPDDDAPADSRSPEQSGGVDSTGAASTEGEPDDVDRVTVRITRDVGSILGVDDREYTLASDDVVTLPERNATPLVERDAAEPLE